MTFLDLHRQLTQTRKARRGISNRRDYYDTPDTYEFDLAIYHKALSIANKIVQHFYDAGAIKSGEKISVVFGSGSIIEKKESPDNSIEHLKKENDKLQAENEKLKKELEDFKGQFKRGGRKGYDATMAEQVKIARANGETWRGLAMRLNISTATAQKLYRQN